MFKAVIFDVDGTLVDSVDLHAKAWQDTFREFGHEFDYDKIRYQIGKGSDQLIPVFFPPEEAERLGEKMADRRHEIFQQKYSSQVKPFPKVRQLMERIKADQKQIVLATSAREDSLQHYKEMLNIQDLVDHAVCTDDVDRSKPEPDIYAASLKKLPNLSPEEAVVIGDTPYDADAAGKVQLATIGVLCGGFPKPDLQEAGCFQVYQDPADLLARYDESPLANGHN